MFLLISLNWLFKLEGVLRFPRLRESCYVMLCYAYMSSYAYIYIFFFSFFLKIKLDIVKLENVFMIVQMKWPAISPLALLFLSVVDF